jgi:hypothetical protein
MYLISISPFSTWSLKKGCLTLIHRIWEQQLSVATYLDFVVDWATEECFWEVQQTREDLRKWQVPEVLFRSIPHLAKSALEKPTRSSEEEAEYQIPNSRVCLRYLKIHWMVVRCEERGEAWKCAHKHTSNKMSGPVTVRYKREPIMLMYSLWSTTSPSSSRCSAVIVLIGVMRNKRITMCKVQWSHHTEEEATWEREEELKAEFSSFFFDPSESRGWDSF